MTEGQFWLMVAGFMFTWFLIWLVAAVICNQLACRTSESQAGTPAKERK